MSVVDSVADRVIESGNVLWFEVELRAVSEAFADSCGGGV
jgi:hypothetical protein